jgi:hypothetical protein
MQIVNDLANGALPRDILIMIYCQASWNIHSDIEELLHCRKCGPRYICQCIAKFEKRTDTSIKRQVIKFFNTFITSIRQ